MLHKLAAHPQNTLQKWVGNMLIIFGFACEMSLDHTTTQRNMTGRNNKLFCLWHCKFVQRLYFTHCSIYFIYFTYAYGFTRNVDDRVM